MGSSPIPRASDNGHYQQGDVMNEQATRHVYENLITAILGFDQQLKLAIMNPAAEMLLDTSAKKLLGQTLDQWLPSKEQGLRQAAAKVLDSQHPLTIREVTIHLPGKRTITVDYSITPVNDHQSDIAMIMEMVQVDRILRLEQEKKMHHLQTTNRAVIRGVSHEIKNPLGGIRGAAQLLASELPDASLQEYTNIIIQEADRLSALVDRMFGPNQPLKKQNVNVHEILEHIRQLVLADVRSDLTITSNYDPSLPEIPGDRDQLIQALLNIVRNATQVMEKAGTIELRSRIERMFTIGQNVHRLAIRLDIIDDGPGIPESLIGDIFYPMVTGRPEGTGLGLSITQDIIARHHGLIQCQSEPGETMFSIYLPLEDNDADN